MKRIILPLFTVLALGIMGTSCRKSDTNTTTTGSYTSLQSIYSDQAPKSKTMTINAATGGSFYGDAGSRFVFPPNAFQTSSGGTVTGNVQIEVKEFINPSDMIFADILPISNNEPLLSGGEVYVNATQGSQTLQMRSHMAFQVNIPQKKTPPPGLGVFFGHGVNRGMNWINPLNKDSTELIIYNGDTVQIFSDSLGFCNADKFMSSPNYQSFSVKPTIDGNPVDSNLTAYALYDNYNGAWKMTNMSAGIISESHVPNTPVHFVIMAIKDGYFYGGIKGITPTTGDTYTIPLSQTDPGTFKAQIDSL